MNNIGIGGYVVEDKWNIKLWLVFARLEYENATFKKSFLKYTKW